MHSSSRRRFLQRSALLAAGTPLAGSLLALGARRARAATTLIASPYGPITPVNDLSTGLALLQLPAGFSYKSFSWTGDPMVDGAQRVPGRHDGMGVVRTRRVGRSIEMTLIRNHERALGHPRDRITGAGFYDNGVLPSGNPANRAAGGTTNLVLRDGDWVSTSPSLGGTLMNCAGGPTPWETWLACEEVASDLASSEGKKHGYVFEVQPDGKRTTGEPLVAMGRFAHEANATDPRTGHVYMTEDGSNRSGLYRYLPSQPGAVGSLGRGGELQMANVVGTDSVDLKRATLGETHHLGWVTIDDPDRNRGTPVFNGAILPGGAASGPFVQGHAQGGCRMGRGEGAWYFDRRMYFVDTAGGPTATPGADSVAGFGSVWELELDTMQFTCVFASPDGATGSGADNITISPRGGILLCEDGGNVPNRLVVVTQDGNTFVLGANNVKLTAAQIAGAGKSVAPGSYLNAEFAGACFDAAGRVLFVNIQTPGITFAITGPWEKGPL
jgi:secreted PhoX family phosphatase